MFRSRIFWGIGLAVALALAFGARSASAQSSTSFDLTVPNSEISNFPPPFATVDVSLDAAGTTATITFTAKANVAGTGGPYTYALVDQGAVALNVNGSFTVQTISWVGMNTAFPSGGFVAPSLANNYTPPNPATEDSFGNMNLTVDMFDSTHAASQSITLTLTGSWTSASTVLTPNDTTHNTEAAAHIVAFLSSNVANGAQVGLTGYAANGGSTPIPPPVPEPSTMVIAGLGALGFVGYGLRRRLKK